jgi:histidine triad (HIT) family protein
MSPICIFCEIIQGKAPASIVHEDELTISFVDLRQFNAGHVLVIPKTHINDVRELDQDTAGALMMHLSKITKAVAQAFPNDGLSIWHSIGLAAFQEVPHLHFHVHPRLPNDDVLSVYPSAPVLPERHVLDEFAQIIRSRLEVK